MDYLSSLVLIAGGILAAAGLIVSKSPNAKDLIAKLAPFQALIGIGLLVVGVLDLIRVVFAAHFFDLVKLFPVLGLSAIAVVACSILLGLLFGMPMLAKLSPQGAAKGEELAKKFAGFQTLIGVVGIIAGLLHILFIAGIIKPM